MIFKKNNKSLLNLSFFTSIIISSIIIIIIQLTSAVIITTLKIKEVNRNASSTADEMSIILQESMYNLDQKNIIKISESLISSGRISGIKIVSPDIGIIVDKWNQQKTFWINPQFRSIEYENIYLGKITLQYNNSELIGFIKMILFSTLALLISVLIANYLAMKYFIQRKTISTFNSLISGINKIESEISNYTIPKSGYNDFDMIIESMNKLSERIESKKKELNKINSTLEKRVKERTFQLETSNNELESFSYSVSHDLRAPLRHINGFAMILKNKIKSDKETDKLIDNIIKASNNMSLLIDNLLNFSKMSKEKMNFIEVDIIKIIENVKDILQQEIKDRKIEWKIDNIPKVYCDMTLMNEVILNLISNAVKFTKNKEIAKIEIGSFQKKDKIVIFINDNGAGFDMSYVNKLFGVFQRLHHVNEFEGTGIGLALVKRIINKHGGDIWAESQVGKGAKFYFSLPYKQNT